MFQGAVPRGNATKDNIAKLGLKDGQVVYKCPKCVSIKPERAHHCRSVSSSEILHCIPVFQLISNVFSVLNLCALVVSCFVTRVSVFAADVYARWTIIARGSTTAWAKITKSSSFYSQ